MGPPSTGSSGLRRSGARAGRCASPARLTTRATPSISATATCPAWIAWCSSTTTGRWRGSTPAVSAAAATLRSGRSSGRGWWRAGSRPMGGAAPRAPSLTRRSLNAGRAGPEPSARARAGSVAGRAPRGPSATPRAVRSAAPARSGATSPARGRRVAPSAHPTRRPAAKGPPRSGSVGACPATTAATAGAGRPATRARTGGSAWEGRTRPTRGRATGATGPSWTAAPRTARRPPPGSTSSFSTSAPCRRTAPARCGRRTSPRPGPTSRGWASAARRRRP
mmetsp:Transcript_17218/g.41094  ORF Transcript_17218/g.41094 Transcript_17218/m.41094 type:complete len:279 (-) Transcript_17218:1250-2086(-)